ncbi:MAG: sigma-54-dependent Fis family transcriptional regulator [Fibrobacteria bacterium]|nr:sigma-54-dependent Fis family transcriptional regulator [Fibrobacteria bacterium]
MLSNTPSPPEKTEDTKNPLAILIVDDEELSALGLKKILTSINHKASVAHDGETALEMIAKEHFDLIITDLMMPGMDGFALVKRIKSLYPDKIVFIFTGNDSFSMARKALSLGADDFLLKPVNLDQLNIALSQADEKLQLKSKIAKLGKMVEKQFSASNIVGSSKPIRQVHMLIEKARKSHANVLIQGESGTGKELVARAIYNHSSDKKSSFVSVNCCAISEGLIESELFGHVKGAFSGAINDRIGLFEEANNGTIFLDEIGDLPLSIQSKLLRAIQEREIRRVGDNTIKIVNVRIIAATNRNLKDAIKTHGFREDLFYRLNVIPINLPSLRVRLSDVPLLVDHFLKKHGEHSPAKSFSIAALKLLQSYHYPGNVRELENIIQRAISFSSSSTITEEDLSTYLQMEKSRASSPELDKLNSLSHKEMKKHMEAIEKKYLIHHLKQSRGNIINAAKAIKITRTAFHNKVKKLNIDLKEIRES